MNDVPDEWNQLLQELSKRRAFALQGGGSERVAREHRAGRLTARERILALADTGSFLELGSISTTPTDSGGQDPSTFICGLAEIDGRPVAVGAEDYTVQGGGVGTHLRQYKGAWGGFIEDVALGYRLPLVLLLQGVGGNVYLQELKGYPDLVSAMPTSPMFDLLDSVPVVAAVLGPTAGSSAARAGISHFSLMTDGNGCLFAGGPPLVKQALGIVIDKLELGGADVHARQSGLIDNTAADDRDALDQVRQFLSYLPAHVTELPPVVSTWNENDQGELLQIMPPNGRLAYDAHALIRCLVDADTFFEIAPDFGRSLRTGLARLEGYPIGVLATDSRHLAGAMDRAAAEKQERFATLCSRFGLPMVYLADIPGLMVGPEAEKSGVIKYGARALRAMQQASVAVYTVQVRRSFGLGGQTTGNPGRMSMRLAWPSGIWGDMPVAGGVEAIFGAQIAASADPAAARKALEERYAAQTSVWRTAERFGVEEMIDPRETRSILARLIRLARRASHSAAPRPDR